jgi:hypothetical protein
MEGGELIDPLPQQQLESLAQQIHQQLTADQDPT